MKKQNLRCVKTMLLAVVACMALVPPPDALADPLTVTTLQDGVPGSLREAILAVGGGGTINFSILGTIKLTNELVIGRNLTIIGPGKGLTVSGNNSNRVFNIAAGATVSISGLSIANGRALLHDGGGIHNVGTLAVSNCTFWYNNADGLGGGIFNRGTLTINNSTFCGNYCPAFGGGIHNQGPLTVNNSTFSGNNAGSGGGIGNVDTLAVNNSTFSGNRGTFPDGNAYYSGGIDSDGTVTIRNTIIAGNTSATGRLPDLRGSFTSQGNNLIGITNGSSGWVASDLSQSGSIAFRQIALLGPFGPNGGPTFTMPPRPGSAAIDRGSNSVLLAPYNFKTDQRGFPRRYGSSVDIGAAEFDPRYFDPKTAAMDFSLRARLCPTCPLEFSFTTSLDPGISSGNIAFVGRTEGGQQSLLLQPLSGPPTVVANTSTAIPGGTGNFVSLLSGPSISGQNVAFSATGASGQQGVYATLNGTLTRIADLNTPISGGTGNFTTFTPPNPITPPSPIISGQNVAFIGNGSGGQQGLYLKTPPDPIKPIADLNTEIPGGTGYFTGFQACSLVGEAAVFIGNGAGGQSGVYVKLPDNPVWNVADTQTLIPGSSNLFVSFNSASYDGSMVAFGAGQWISAEGGPIFEGGVYKTAPGGPPFTVADNHTAIPGGTGFFTRFGPVAIDSGAVAFLGWRGGGLGEAAGIYTDLGGVLSKVIATGDSFQGKTVTNLDFGPFGFSQGQVAFTATFQDGSQSLIQGTEAPQLGPDFIVTTTDDHDDGVPGTFDCTLREAINAANTNAGPHTITFAPGITGVITLGFGELVVSQTVYILGPGASLLTVSGHNASRVFRLTAGESLINNLRIADGYSEGNGGGIAVSGGVLFLANCEVAGCYADSVFGGGGLSVGPGGLSMIASTIHGNRTPYYGGGISVNSGAGIVSLINSTVSGNSAGGGFFDANGGGIYVGNANLNIIDSTIANNSSATAGGGISRSGTVTIRNSLIAGNSAPTGPDCNGTFVSYGYNLIGNAGGSSGFGETGDQLDVDPLIGPLQDNGGPTFTHALRPGSPAIDKGLSFGYTTDQRGGIRPFDFVSVINASGGDGSDIGAFEVGSGDLLTLIVSNTNDNGPGSLRQVIGETYSGGIVTFASNVVGTITLTSGELLINRSLRIEGPGAAILTVSGNNTNRVFHITGGPSQVSDLRIANGSAAGGGGGIAMEGGSLTVSNCSITGCYAHGVDVVSQGGGAIAVVGTANLTIIASTLSSNTTPYAGGGLYLFNAPTVSLVNCTVSGNRTLDGELGDGGGGIFVGNSSKLNVTNSTIANNSAAVQGGGVYKGLSGTVALRNSLVAGNSAGGLGPDCKGTFASAGYNLIGNSSGSTGFGSTGDQLNLNAQIGALADNGGPTWTHALLAGSPATDKGGSGGPSTDQRGRARAYDFSSVANAPGGDDSDIGAFELNPPLLSIARAAGNVLVSWPAYDTGYTLEAKTNLNPSINWSNVPGTPAIVAGQFTVTNSATSGDRFYRLRSP